jgi:guanosine-3',5'-bis(diphosphate) 3'-pyrophosphohydrolase
VAETSTRAASATAVEHADAALRFARRVHLGQHRRQTHDQYVEHPIAVARLLSDAGFEDRVLVAAYLHDVVEKTLVESDEIRVRFGPEVAELVEALSEDPELSGYAERKRALRAQVLRAGRTTTVIYAADRVANLRDWTSLAPASREACAGRLGTTLEERLALWREDLDELTAFDSELPFLGEIEVELRTLNADFLAAREG